jgi:hypothetical protein
VRGIGQHVRDDERAHEPPTVALWNDGSRERCARQSL